MIEINNIKVKRDCVILEAVRPEIRYQISEHHARLFPREEVCVVINRSQMVEMLRELGFYQMGG